MAPEKTVTSALREGRKALHKHGFRNRFFKDNDDSTAREEEERQRAVKEDVINNFLKAGRSDAGSSSSNGGSARISAGTGTSRWPAPSQVRHLAAGDSLTGAAPEPKSLVSSSRPKRSKGLNVKFSDAQPQVIGEGGEEHDMPTIEISRRHAGARGGTTARLDRSLDTDDVQRSRAVPQSGPDSTLPKPRWYEQVEAPDGKLLPAETPRGPLPAVLQAGRTSSVLGKNPPRSASTIARIQARRMQNEEGALHRANSIVVSPTSTDSPTTPSSVHSRTERDASRTPEPSYAKVKSPTDTIAYLSLSSATGSPTRSPARSPARTPQLQKDFDGLPPPLPPRIELDDEPSMAQARQLEPEPVALNKLTSRGMRLPFHDPPRSEARASPNIVGAYISDNDSDDLEDPVPEPLIKVPTESALELFSSKVRPLSALFRLSSDGIHSTDDLPLRDWIRASAWWFINGRADLYLALQRVPPDFPVGTPLVLFPPVRRAFVDLAKSWWIVDTVAPTHPQISDIELEEAGALIDAVKSLGDPILEDAVRMWDLLVEEFGSMAAYLEQQGVLTHDGGDITLVQGADTSIWVNYPLMPDRTAEILSTASGANSLFDCFAIHDRHTSGRMLVEAVVTVAKPDVTQFRLLCLFTLSTDPRSGAVTGAVASQSPVLSLVIHEEVRNGPTWDDLDWHIPNRVVTLLYQDEMTISIAFGESDFKELRRLTDAYGSQPHISSPPPPKSMPSRPNEALAYETTILCFQDSEPTQNGRSQLLEPIEGCTLRLFEILNIRQGASSGSVQHGGMRLSITGGPANIANFETSLGVTRPIIFNFLRGDNGYPAMLLRVGSKPSKDIIITFGEEGERIFFLSLLNGLWLRSDESIVKELSLKCMTVGLKTMDEVHVEPTSDYLWTQPWVRCSYIEADPRKATPEHQGMTTDRRRLFADFGAGTFTDRLSMGLGEVFIAMSPVRPNEICVLRPRQDNLTITISKNQASEDLVGAVSYAYQNMMTWETIRRYQFKAIQDLHFFQLIMTGFEPAFDGVVPSFSITRRRMVVSLHKKWEAFSARIQVVKKAGNIQLLAFFKDFSHGDCMSLPLKGTDSYETYDRGGKYFLKIVEAKFPLPKTRESENRVFLSLDNPEYPSEHDDILITFDSETERSRFADVLPGTVSRVSALKALMK